MITSKINKIILFSFFTTASIGTEEEFKWSWQKDQKPESKNDYIQLMQENIELRKRIEEVNKLLISEKAKWQQENFYLQEKISELVNKLREMSNIVSSIKTDKSLEKEKDSRTIELERELSQANDKLLKAEATINELRELLRTLPSREGTGIKNQSTDSGELISDLEKQILLLKNQLIKVEEERKNALDTISKLTEKFKNFEEVSKLIKEKEDIIVALKAENVTKTQEIDKLKSKLSELVNSLKEKELEIDRYKEMEKELSNLKIELDRSKFESLKASKTMEILKKEREEFQHQLNIEKTTLQYNMGVLYMQMGKLEEAKQCFLQVIMLNPVDDPAHYNLGIIYERLGEFEKAISHYRRYIKLNPSAVDADKVRTWITDLETRIRVSK